MQISLHCDRILREEQRMDIKPKRNGSIPKFPDAIHWLESTRHANLNHSITESPNIGDNINISCANIGCTKVNFFDFSIKPLKLRPNFLRLTHSSLHHKRLKHVLIVLALLIKFRSTLSELLLSLALFTKPCLLLTLRLLLRFFRILIPER